MRAFATAVAAVAALACVTPASGADVRDVHLIDQAGAPFTLRALGGAPVAITFVASRCTDTCPVANGLFARVAAHLRARGVAARLVSVTLDPAYDTPFVMAGLARSFGAQRARWRFASGRPRDVERVLQAFAVVHDGVESHGTFVYVLDRRGRLVRTLPLSTNAVEEIDAVLATTR